MLPSFDVRQVPFSRAGSWLALSPVVGEGDVREQVHLVTHVNGQHGVLELQPLVGDEVVVARVDADPSALRWSTPAGSLVAVFADPATVRVEGTGLGLRLRAADTDLTPFTGTYAVEDPVTDTVVLTSYETGRRYRVGVLRGVVEVEGLQRTGTCERSVTVRPDPGGQVELWLQELVNTAPPPELPGTVEELRTQVEDEFTAYVDAVAPWRCGLTPAAALAVYVVWSATVDPGGFVTERAVLMSKHWMDRVWSWDHCFNALALAEGDPVLAWQQLRLPFAHADEHGALPDSITHGEVLHNFVKPPVHGWALAGLLDRVAEPPAPGLLRQVYEELAAWTTWWRTLRTVPARGLPHYQHGNDSGWDNSTVFGEEQLLETADLAAFLAVQMRVLADVAADLGLDEESRAWDVAAEQLAADLVRLLWDGEQLVSHAVASGVRRRTRSLLPKLALLLGEDLPREVQDALVEQLAAHLTEHGLATEPVDSPDYEPDGYWRGPIWAPSTVLAVEGLRRCGRDDLADDVAHRFLRLCEAHGFAENFDAVTGRGLRDLAYTWTASAYLLLARERVLGPPVRGARDVPRTDAPVH